MLLRRKMWKNGCNILWMNHVFFSGTFTLVIGNCCWLICQSTGSSQMNEVQCAGFYLLFITLKVWNQILEGGKCKLHSFEFLLTNKGKTYFLWILIGRNFVYHTLWPLFFHNINNQDFFESCKMVFISYH